MVHMAIDIHDCELFQKRVVLFVNIVFKKKRNEACALHLTMVVFGFGPVHWSSGLFVANPTSASIHGDRYK